MTAAQQLQAVELIAEAIQKSDDPVFNFRAIQFLDGVNEYTSTPEAVPIVIREVVGSVRPVYGPKDSPLNEYIGGPA